MVRTKADGADRRAVAAKAPRKSLGSSNSGAGSSAGFNSPKSAAKAKDSGNSVCPRPTPSWQKGIDTFLSKGKKSQKENTEPSETGESSPITSGVVNSEARGSSQSSSQGSSSSSSTEAGSSSSQGASKESSSKNGIISDDEDD